MTKDRRPYYATRAELRAINEGLKGQAVANLNPLRLVRRFIRLRRVARLKVRPYASPNP
jgi:hypothetical protein